MPKKLFDCVKCGGVHERPINSKCKNIIEKDIASINESEMTTQDSNALILQELKNLSSRMAAMEKKVQDKDSQQASPSVRSSVSRTSDTEDEFLLPSIATLKQSHQIQRQVDERVKQLQTINEQGKFKSQRGGSETVYVKKEVPWPHNFVLGGSKKSRVSYDALSLSQWVAGFSQIIREEPNNDTRNQMLDYLTDLMEDSHDFGWQAAKGSHAVLLCRMEDGKITWDETSKIDRVRRAHAQRLTSGHPQNVQSKKGERKDRAIPCKFFQKDSCSHTKDHETNGQLYLHVCSICHSQGKSLTHTSSTCRNRTKND